MQMPQKAAATKMNAVVARCWMAAKPRMAAHNPQMT